MTSARNWYFLIYFLGEISQVRKVFVTIKFNKKVLNKEFEEYKLLHNQGWYLAVWPGLAITFLAKWSWPKRLSLNFGWPKNGQKFIYIKVKNSSQLKSARFI